jgi:hypothetical protein
MNADQNPHADTEGFSAESANLWSDDEKFTEPKYYAVNRH